MLSPSRGRQLLALYLDLLLLVGLLAPFAWVLRRAWPALSSVPVALVLFVPALLGLRATLGRTFGQAALGIDGPAHARFVHPRWRVRERRWTMLVGVLGVMEGAKEFARWTERLPPPPYMGLSLAWDEAALVVTVSGLAYMAAGLGVLACHTRAAALGVLLSVLTTISWLASWSSVPAWVEARTLVRRALQGVPVAEGELARMQWILPGGALLGSVVGGAWLVLVWRHFRRLDRAHAL